MKNLLLSLTIGLLIASCSSSSSSDQKTNLVKTKIGAWTSIYNKDNPKDSHLNWDGKSTFSKSSTSTMSADSSKWGYYDNEGMWHADTVVYNNTSQHVSMTAKMLNYEGYGDFIPVLVYKDSTLNEETRQQIHEFSLNMRPVSGFSSDFQGRISGFGYPKDFTHIRVPYKSCSDSLQLTDGSDYIKIRLHTLPNDFEDTYNKNGDITFIKIYMGPQTNQAIQDMCANVVK